jgi:hypothetical protein
VYFSRTLKLPSLGTQQTDANDSPGAQHRNQRQKNAKLGPVPQVEAEPLEDNSNWISKLLELPLFCYF